ncbi:MAG: ARMT1-like domain-containing protein [Methanomassiliicoccales archaeon]
MEADCIPCLLGRVLFETNLCAPEKKSKVMRECIKVLSEKYRPGVNSALTATAVHRRAYDLLECRDPYADLKKRSNEVAEWIFWKAKEIVKCAKDPLEAASLVAIAGNVLDFGIGAALEDPEKLADKFDSLVSQGLAINDVPRMREILEKAESIVFLIDNCGEIVFDRLLVAELRWFGVRVVGVVKGEPILTDATEEDVRSTGIDKLFDEILTTGSFAVGIDLKRVGKCLRSEFNDADLIVSKGMANFESLSDTGNRPIVHLLRAKCLPVAKAIGAKKEDNVVKVYE